jgi:hypothetical protein
VVYWRGAKAPCVVADMRERRCLNYFFLSSPLPNGVRVALTGDCGLH